MGINWEGGGYSAHVEMFVLVDGCRMDVAQIGPDTLILRNPVQVRKGYAEIIIRVDGREEKHKVILHSTDDSNAELAYA